MELKKFTELSTVQILNINKIKLEKKEGFICPETGGILVLKPGSLVHSFIEYLLLMQNRLCSVSDLLKIKVNVSDDEKVNLIIMLFKKGFLVIDDNIFSAGSDSKIHNMIIKPERKKNLCVFHMHNYCNLGCEYCYMVDPLVKKKIDIETMELTAYKLQNNGVKKINFEFHGGEPTMSMNLIKKFIDKLENDTKYKFTEVSYSIQTNGYHLSDKDIKYLASKNFNIRISLDGLEEIHDDFRRTKNNKGTYISIIKNIEKLNSMNNYPEVCCVVHKHNLHLLKDMFENLSSLEVSGIRFLPIFRVENLSGNYYMSGRQYANEIYELIKYAFEKNKFYLLTNLISGEVNAVTTLNRNYMCMKSPCGAGIEMIGIDINGEVYPCEEMIGNEDFSFGNIKNIDLELIKSAPIMKKLSLRNTNNIKKCRTCIWKENCHSGCPKKSFNKFETLDRESDMCEYYRAIFPLIVDFFYNKEKGVGIYESIDW